MSPRRRYPLRLAHVVVVVVGVGGTLRESFDLDDLWDLLAGVP